jgi:hypothetical protein
MAESNWLDFILRAWGLIAPGYGAYRDYRRQHRGMWSRTAFALNLALLLLYFGGATFILYGLVLDRDHRAAFLLIAIVYVAIGLPTCWKLATYIDMRFAPKQQRYFTPP